MNWLGAQWARGFGIALVVMGCGARSGLPDTDPSPKPAHSDQAGSEKNKPVSPDAIETADEPGNPDEPFGMSEGLPPCKLGPERSSSAMCLYAYSDHCYESRLEACACACPANRTDTYCIAGLPDEFGTTEIQTCQ
ncbi:MAG TPA: hypothetical protein VHM70_13105 [Polyangiaceae bacterium]|nr:hypothetical protein [Polyangiaceae bacterium]